MPIHKLTICHPFLIGSHKPKLGLMQHVGTPNVGFMRTWQQPNPTSTVVKWSGSEQCQSQVLISASPWAHSRLQQ